MRVTVILFFISCSICFSQKVQSKGDLYFFQYSYTQAILEYEKDLNKGELSQNQYLNLAESYYNVGAYKKAKDTYVKVYSKDSKLLSNHQFNKMLQSLNKTQDFAKADSIFKSRKGKISGELVDNNQFNK